MLAGVVRQPQTPPFRSMAPPSFGWDARGMRKAMNPSVVLAGLAVLFSVLAASATAMAQTSLERGRYLVDAVMTCHNCHTPRGPNGFEFDKALSGGLRFDEPPFDVWATNITPDRDSGIGSWSDAEIK